MKFYHGTTQETWDKIKKDGQLWGYPKILTTYPEFYEMMAITGGVWPDDFRLTYLATSIEYAKEYSLGGVLLEVEYEPSGNPDIDSFNPSDLDKPISVMVSIPLSNIEVVENSKFSDLTTEDNKKEK